MPLTLTAAADDDGRRLDRILRKALRNLPLSAIHRLLRQNRVRIDGKAAAADRRIRAGEIITVLDSGEQSLSPPGRQPAPHAPPPHHTDKKLDHKSIIFEGSGLLILNKPSGLTVHGGADSLAEQALSYLTPKLPPSLSFKPGPLHRLYKPSSGIIVFSASLEGAREFSALLRERKIKKFYLAIVEGIITKPLMWRDELSRDTKLRKTFTAGRYAAGRPAAGKPKAEKQKNAVTKIIPLAHNAGCSLVQAEIETGRYHQIRAQAAAHGHPLLGDTKYGGKKSGGGFLLHAWRMEFPAGISGDNPFPGLPGLIEAPLPDYFKRKINELFGEKFFGGQVL